MNFHLYGNVNIHFCDAENSSRVNTPENVAPVRSPLQNQRANNSPLASLFEELRSNAPGVSAFQRNNIRNDDSSGNNLEHINLANTIQRIIDVFPASEMSFQVLRPDFPENTQPAQARSTDISLLLNNSNVSIINDQVVANDETCSICHNRYTNRDIIRSMSPCGHFFHIGCADAWFCNHTTCPLCRANLNAESS
jgi:hypothetical protein